MSVEGVGDASVDVVLLAMTRRRMLSNCVILLGVACLLLGTGWALIVGDKDGSLAWSLWMMGSLSLLLLGLYCSELFHERVRCLECQRQVLEMAWIEENCV